MDWNWLEAGEGKDWSISCGGVNCDFLGQFCLPLKSKKFGLLGLDDSEMFEHEEFVLQEEADSVRDMTVSLEELFVDSDWLLSNGDASWTKGNTLLSVFGVETGEASSCCNNESQPENDERN